MRQSIKYVMKNVNFLNEKADSSDSRSSGDTKSLE